MRGSMALACAMAAGAGLLAVPLPAAADEGRGAALFEARCAMCHVVGFLRGKGSRLVNDLRQIDPAMFPVGILTDTELASLAAYLDAPPTPKQP